MVGMVLLHLKRSYKVSFRERYDLVKAECEAICVAHGRDPHAVKVVAVSKTVGLPEIETAIAAGAHAFGENRPDMLASKAAALPDQEWHFIGNIQSRKIEEIVRFASLVHSLYQPHHVAKFDAAAASLGKVQNVLLEVNVSGEQSKSGLAPDQVALMLEVCEQYSHVRVCGLMTMAPQGNADVARDCFAQLALLAKQLKAGMDPAKAQYFNELSMGMSEDWREAVSQGATIVRIGRALFAEDFDEPHAQG